MHRMRADLEIAANNIYTRLAGFQVKGLKTL